eukprot:RCo036500
MERSDDCEVADSGELPGTPLKLLQLPTPDSAVFEGLDRKGEGSRGGGTGRRRRRSPRSSPSRAESCPEWAQPPAVSDARTAEVDGEWGGRGWARAGVATEEDPSASWA